MAAIRSIFILMSALFVFRTIFRCIGQSKMQKFEVLACLFVCWCAYFAVRMKIFIVFAAFIVISKIFGMIKNRIPKNNDELVSQYLDQLLMNMRAGLSFESAHRSLKENEKWEQWFSCSQIEKLTNGQESEIISLLRICHLNPSQTFKVLSSYRTSLRLQNRLQQKRDSMTLQARAQAGVSIGLFIVLFCAQWFLQPDFIAYLQTSAGKLGITASVLLLGSGVLWVFKLSQGREFEL
jgi:Flp pilus assembly protein TadB